MAFDLTAWPARLGALALARPRCSTSSGRMPRSSRRKRAPFGATMRVVAAIAVGQQRERIEIEGADDARVQALEVEDEHVAVEPGQRVHHVAADAAAPLAGAAADRRRDAPAARSAPR